MAMQTKPTPITKSKLLAVEGKDEINFFEELFKHIGMADAVDLREVGGKDQFNIKMPTLLKNITGYNKLEAVAIIRDADESSENTFESIKEVLKKNGLQAPKNPGEFSEGNPKVGIFIMPDNSNKGMLENLCLETVKETEEMKCVNQFITCAKKLKNPPKEKDLPKAQVQAFLAIKTNVPNSVGRGAQKGHWNFNSDQLVPLKNFLSQLK